MKKVRKNKKPDNTQIPKTEDSDYISTEQTYDELVESLSKEIENLKNNFNENKIYK